MEWNIPKAGFLSSEVEDAVPAILGANHELFGLARDANHLIMAIVQETVNTVHTSSMSEEAVLVRLLMRAAGFYQGALLMAERGMFVECRAMARSVIEVSLAVSAMDGDKDTFIQMIRDDHMKSRRNRYQTLLAQSTEPKVRKALHAAIGQLEKSLNIISPKALAALGPLEASYFVYQVLSDNAAHVSASSLDHYIAPHEDRKYWEYKVGAGAPGSCLSLLLFIRGNPSCSWRG